MSEYVCCFTWICISIDLAMFWTEYLELLSSRFKLIFIVQGALTLYTYHRDKQRIYFYELYLINLNIYNIYNPI